VEIEICDSVINMRDNNVCVDIEAALVVVVGY